MRGRVGERELRKTPEGKDTAESRQRVKLIKLEGEEKTDGHCVRVGKGNRSDSFNLKKGKI